MGKLTTKTDDGKLTFGFVLYGYVFFRFGIRALAFGGSQSARGFVSVPPARSFALSLDFRKKSILFSQPCARRATLPCGGGILKMISFSGKKKDVWGNERHGVLKNLPY